MDSYEEIVRNWYNKIKPLFHNTLSKRYGNLLSADDIEDLYQETFMAVYENLRKGTVKYNTAWSAYLIEIGKNLATKKIGKSLKSESLDGMYGYDEEKQEMQVRRVESLLQEYMQEDDSLCNNNEIVHVLGDALQFTPEPCSTIIRLFYYKNDIILMKTKKIGGQIYRVKIENTSFTKWILKNIDNFKIKKVMFYD